MTTQQFKKLGRLLKQVYAELEAEALKEGVSTLSPEYDILITKAREKVLESQGFTLQEYREAKAKVAGFSQADLVEETEKIDEKISTKVVEEVNRIIERVNKLEQKHIPDEAEIAQISHEVSKEYIVPPQITNQIVKETIIEQPITVKEEYDDSELKKLLSEIPKPYDDTAIKEYFHNYFNENFKKNIDMLGMPDFRKLAMGLRGDIDRISNASDLSGYLTSATAASTYVPYTGATTDVDLGAHNFTVDTNTFFVDATNNRVGVGNIAPSVALDVTGAGQFGTAGATTSQLTVLGGSGGNSMITLSRTSGATIAFSWALAGGGLSFTDDTNSKTVLNLFGKDSILQAYIGQKDRTSSGAVDSYLAATSYTNAAGADLAGTNLYIKSGGGVGTGTLGNMYFQTAVAGLTTVAQTFSTKMTILGNGNVGIGTVTPGDLLEVGSSLNSYNKIVIGRDNTGSSGGTALVFKEKNSAGTVRSQNLLGSYWITSTAGSEIPYFSITQYLNGGTTEAFALRGGNLGLGNTNPTAKLYVSATNDEASVFVNTYTGTSGSHYANIFQNTTTPTGAETAGQDLIAVNARLYITGTNTYHASSQGRAFYMDAQYQGTQTYADLRGAFIDIYNTAGGTLTSAYGGIVLLRNTGAGTITNGYGFQIRTPVNSGGGTFSNFTGIDVQSPSTATGTVYGYRSQVASGATRWNAYFDGTAQNYFVGNTNIGLQHTTPTEELEIQGSSDVVAKIYAQGARSDANTPSPRLYFYKDITSGTVTANDDQALILVNSDDASNNLGNSHQIKFAISGVTAGAVTTDILFQTVNNTSIGTLSTVLTLSGSAATFAGTITSGSTLIMGANSITMTGSLGATGARVTKGWFTDIESTNEPTVGGVQTKLLLAGGTMTGNIQLGENASLDLDPAGSADGKYTGTCITGTAGATLAFGDLIYLDPTDSRWELCDANAASAADGDSRGILGICVLAAAADGSATKILLFGIVRADTAFPAMTINAPMYVSETAGDITGTIPTTTDAVQRSVGTAITADELYFFPSPHYQTAI